MRPHPHANYGIIPSFMSVIFMIKDYYSHRLNFDIVLLFQQDRNNAMDELLEVERLQVIDFALEQQNAGKNNVNPSSSFYKKGGTKKSKPK